MPSVRQPRGTAHRGLCIEPGTSLIAIGSVGDHRQRTVIIAMIAMRMMQASIDEIVDVVTVRNCLMTAAGAMPMRRFMSARTVLRRATIGVAVGHFEDVVLGMAILHMLQMTVIEIIEVVLMPNGNMAAVGAMDVRAFVSRLIGGGHSLASPAVRCRPDFLATHKPRMRFRRDISTSSSRAPAPSVPPRSRGP